MNQYSKEYTDKYKLAKKYYLEGKSLTWIEKNLHMGRGSLSKHLKDEGIEIINKQNITKFNEHIFDIIDTEEKAYWLGFLYADGSIGSTRNEVELSLKSSDIHHLEKFRDFLGFSIDKHIFQDDVRCRISFLNKHCHSQLIDKGCVPRKSLILKFPSRNCLPLDLVNHFVRGYVDGDGSVMIGRNNMPRLSILGTKDMITNIVDNMSWKKTKIRKKDNIYTIEWGGKYVLSYLDSLYNGANIYLDRKYKKYLQLKELDENLPS
jgi:hypothetical protein